MFVCLFWFGFFRFTPAARATPQTSMCSTPLPRTRDVTQRPAAGVMPSSWNAQLERNGTDWIVHYARARCTSRAIEWRNGMPPPKNSPCASRRRLPRARAHITRRHTLRHGFRDCTTAQPPAHARARARRALAAAATRVTLSPPRGLRRIRRLHDASSASSVVPARAFLRRRCITDGRDCSTRTHGIIFHSMTLYSMTLHYITLWKGLLDPNAWHYIPFHDIPFHYITLHYITLYCITLHYITLHYTPIRFPARGTCMVIECNDARQCNVMQCNAMRCNAMQRDATRCNAMQRDATQHNVTMQRNVT